MKISPKLYGRMDGSKFWCFPWFPENSSLCVILRYTVYLDVCFWKEGLFITSAAFFRFLFASSGRGLMTSSSSSSSSSSSELDYSFGLKLKLKKIYKWTLKNGSTLFIQFTFDLLFELLILSSRDCRRLTLSDFSDSSQVLYFAHDMFSRIYEFSHQYLKKQTNSLLVKKGNFFSVLSNWEYQNKYYRIFSRKKIVDTI